MALYATAWSLALSAVSAPAWAACDADPQVHGFCIQTEGIVTDTADRSIVIVLPKDISPIHDGYVIEDAPDGFLEPFYKVPPVSIVGQFEFCPMAPRMRPEFSKSIEWQFHGCIKSVKDEKVIPDGDNPDAVCKVVDCKRYP